ncbi:MAG: tetratricopeptide repeat protein [Alphaproteobacteria bacterium]|nr:tetratricopeptide repeat protein [Alphaproteobacteria bacterium]
MNSARERFEKLAAIYRSSDYEAAASAVAAALRAAPKDPNLLHLAAQAAEAQGESARAVMFYRRALAANPGWPEAAFNLAAVLNAQGQHEEAIALMTDVSRVRPALPQVWEALAKFNQAAGDIPSALVHWEKALALKPEQQEWRAQKLLLKRQICDWNFPATAIDTLPPQAVTVLTDDPAVQKTAAQQYAQQKFKNIASFPAPSWKPHNRLRVGYLSSDFHAHATAYLMAELFGLHDREKFEIFAYSYGADDRSAMRARLKEQAGHFIELNKLSAEKAARRIREDEIDVLIDLKGHTRGSRLEILAFRPSPVQVHWLGYPGTLGAEFIDYFAGDAVTIPEGHEKYFTERVIRLPRCYQINDRQRTIAAAKPRGAYGLPENALVLASFNQTYKITPEMFALWCGILKEVPEAVLWLYQSNSWAPDKLRDAAQKNGVDPSQLIFAQPLPLDQHLARYSHVDLALDTHPVGGHTTTSDALWAGTPVVTLMGKSFVSRVAASILTAAELPQLVTSSLEEYEKLIVSLMRDKEALSNLKQRLKARRGFLPLFDTPRFVKDWERVLQSIGECCPVSE